MSHISALHRAALFGLLQSVFSDVHPFCDQILQSSADARAKGGPGQAGRAACARHVASYTAGQVLATLGVTRALGLRLGAPALATGAAINAITHYVIDRRAPLRAFLTSPLIGKTAYLQHVTVQRRPGVIDDCGPGTSFMECDQALHRVIGVLASATTAALATAPS